jgi:cystathionine beta-lyase
MPVLKKGAGVPPHRTVTGTHRRLLSHPRPTAALGRRLQHYKTTVGGQLFDFNARVDRCSDGESSLKWGRYRKAGEEGVLPMWVADMDFRSPPCVLDALRARVEHGVFGYATPPAALVEATQKHIAARHGWEVHPEWLVWLNGLVPALNLVCRIAGEPGDSILVPTPVYTPFLTAPRNSERVLHALPLLPVLHGGCWSLDWRAMHAAVTSSSQPRPRAFLLCNPHNPVRALS